MRTRPGSLPSRPFPSIMARLTSRRTVRFRLVMLSSVLFLAAGAGLLAITYGLVDGSTAPTLFVEVHGTRIAVDGTPGTSGRYFARDGGAGPTAAQLQLARQLYAREVAQHAHDLHQLLIQSGVALAIMAALAVALGWLLAGRMLRPLRVMKATTRQISERNLHERLSLTGPRDEVTDLADTIDELLARLERAFTAQRRFVASASHELRTPLTLSRALLEVALADPAASGDELRATCEELLVAGEQQERLIDGLLTLATSERGLDHRDEFDLADVTRRTLATHYALAEQRGLTVTFTSGHAIVLGDPDLAERMAANLIDNAIKYNRPGGTVDVTTGLSFGHPVLAVANTGPVIPADQADQLFQPFQRLASGHPNHPDGHGLGLSIVRAIADAHNARLEVLAHPHGGLTITTRFPARSGPDRGYEILVQR